MIERVGEQGRTVSETMPRELIEMFRQTSLVVRQQLHVLRRKRWVINKGISQDSVSEACLLELRRSRQSAPLLVNRCSRMSEGEGDLPKRTREGVNARLDSTRPASA